MSRHEKRIKVMDMVIQDMENDVREMEGQPATGKVIAEMFGKQAAAISALAEAIKEILNEGT